MPDAVSSNPLRVGDLFIGKKMNRMSIVIDIVLDHEITFALVDHGVLQIDVRRLPATSVWREHGYDTREYWHEMGWQVVTTESITG